MKIGILFSGQGAQKPGMGIDLLADPLFAQTVADASEATGLDITTILRGEHGELNQTANVQPALVTVSYGIYRMLCRDLPKLPVAGMVGLSLGEYAALLAAQALSAADGFKLLADRGRYMQTDADAQAGGLAALVDPQEKVVDQVLATSTVRVANYNSPHQLVIGGPAAELKTVVAQLKAAKAAKKIVILRVSGAFHTPLFNNARQKMHDRLASVSFATPRVPVISNTTVQPFTADHLAEILERQLAVPTHFGADLQYLIDHEKIDQTLEIGPGKTLSHFARQVDRHLQRAHIATMADYEDYVKEHQEWS